MLVFWQPFALIKYQLLQVLCKSFKIRFKIYFGILLLSYKVNTKQKNCLALLFLEFERKLFVTTPAFVGKSFLRRVRGWLFS